MLYGFLETFEWGPIGKYCSLTASDISLSNPWTWERWPPIIPWSSGNSPTISEIKSVLQIVAESSTFSLLINSSSEMIAANLRILWTLSKYVPSPLKKFIFLRLETFFTKFWDLSLFQKNSASSSLALTTLSFPILINPLLSFLFAITINSLVISCFFVKRGKYFWCDCIVKTKISFGIDRNFLSNEHSIIYGWSTRLLTSSNNFSLSSIIRFFFFKTFSISFLMKSFLLSWSKIVPDCSRDFW